MTDPEDLDVLIRVQPTDRSGRQISNRTDPAESLRSREADIERGVAAGARMISASIPTMTSPTGWSLQTVEAKFGITLGAEGSVIVSKASFEATLEVTLRYGRTVSDLSA